MLGSSKLTGIVGRKEPSGTVNVLAYTAVASSDFMTKGRVYNVEKMTAALKNIKETLEEKTGRHISSMYMGIDCMGIGNNDMKDAFVIDPLIGKKQQLQLATQLCRMVLKVNNVIVSGADENDF